jgi:hypothetical protein
MLAAQTDDCLDYLFGMWGLKKKGEFLFQIFGWYLLMLIGVLCSCESKGNRKK